MGARRLITEEVLLRDASGLDAGTANFGTPDADGGLGHAVAAQEQRNGAGQAGMESYTRQRHTTDLEWTMEFVGRKIQNCILSGLKTAKVHILLFGSPREWPPCASVLLSWALTFSPRYEEHASG